MPLWLWAVLGLGGYYLISRSGLQPPVSGAQKYTTNKNAAAYQADPSLIIRAGGKVPAVAQSLPLNTVVYATAVPPTLSSDASYELVKTSYGNLWVSIADLTITA